MPPVHELVLIGIFDAGVPNLERIVLRPTQPLNLAAFGLMLGSANGEAVTPMIDQFFWLGERWISPPAWVVVFTGPGVFKEARHQQTGEPIVELHWGKATVALGAPGLAVSVVRIGAIGSYLASSQAGRALPPA